MLHRSSSIAYPRDPRRRASSMANRRDSQNLLRPPELIRRSSPVTERPSVDFITTSFRGQLVQYRSSFHKSFRDSDRLQEIRRRMQRTPKWLKIAKAGYHKYGGKHAMLLLILILYSFLGAAIFFYLERFEAEDKESAWRLAIQANRTRLINGLMPQIFNRSDLLIFIDPDQSEMIWETIENAIKRYENDLGIKYTDRKIEWDFWNAMLYSGTIVTTIGYGHLYPSTNAGRIATMIYALIGIPLVFSILDDVSKLLIVGLKYPWIYFKMLCRRMFRYCTKQTLDEIRELDDEDKQNLEINELPIIVAIGVVFLWIFICSATFCIWETNWNYLIAFYFFFISLSTIGLGDIVPEHPKYLLFMFFYIIIGLSLVSMCVSLIQLRLQRTYEKGKDTLELQEDLTDDTSSANHLQPHRSPLRNKLTPTLGVIRSSSYSSSKTSSPKRGSIL